MWHPAAKTKGEVRPAHSPRAEERSQPLSPSGSHRLPEAGGAASGASLKCGAPWLRRPNESSGRWPGAKLWLPILWTAAMGETFATPACGWETWKKRLRPEHSRRFPGYTALLPASQDRETVASRPPAGSPPRVMQQGESFSTLQGSLGEPRFENFRTASICIFRPAGLLSYLPRAGEGRPQGAFSNGAASCMLLFPFNFLGLRRTALIQSNSSLELWPPAVFDPTNALSCYIVVSPVFFIF